MNATLVNTSTAIGPGVGIEMPSAVAAAYDLADRTIARASKRERLLVGTLGAPLLLGVVQWTMGREVATYLGLFELSVLVNAIPILPGGGAAMLLAAAKLNPILVAVLAAVGGAVGKIPGYSIGCSSRKFIADKKIPEWLTRIAAKHMTTSIVLVSLVPNPLVDVIGVVAGRSGYPLHRFITVSTGAKLVQSLLFVYIGLHGLSLAGF